MADQAKAGVDRGTSCKRMRPSTRLSTHDGGHGNRTGRIRPRVRVRSSVSAIPRDVDPIQLQLVVARIDSLDRKADRHLCVRQKIAGA